jgi:pimeloyl-ACP methyl ester carboxylesterase
MDHYADDLAAVTAHLDLKNAVHVGHSTGGARWCTTSPAMARVASRRPRSSLRCRR